MYALHMLNSKYYVWDMYIKPVFLYIYYICQCYIYNMSEETM